MGMFPWHRAPHWVDTHPMRTHWNTRTPDKSLTSKLGTLELRMPGGT